MSAYLNVGSGVADVGHTTVSGLGSAFGWSGTHELTYPFPDFSDQVSADTSSELAFGGDSGDAALDKDGGGFRTIFLGFPFEAIANTQARISLMRTVLSFCDMSCTGGFNVCVSDQTVESPLVVEACNAIANGPGLRRTEGGFGLGWRSRAPKLMGEGRLDEWLRWRRHR